MLKKIRRFVDNFFQLMLVGFLCEGLFLGPLFVTDYFFNLSSWSRLGILALGAGLGVFSFSVSLLFSFWADFRQKLWRETN